MSLEVKDYQAGLQEGIDLLRERAKRAPADVALILRAVAEELVQRMSDDQREDDNVLEAK